MKQFLIAMAFTLISFGLQAQQQSISLPIVVPTHCTSSPCKVFMSQNATAVIIAIGSGSGAITDSLGGTWVQDFCIPFDNGDCQFHAQLNLQYPTGDTLTFPAGTFTDVYILQYEGSWNFLRGQRGGYDAQNFPFPDCTDGNDCPYNWTLPVYAESGNLIIAYSFSQSSGPGLPKPGPGWSVEANDGFLVVEDMIAPIESIYTGQLIQKMPDGSDSGGSHWLMGIGVYSRVH